MLPVTDKWRGLGTAKRRAVVTAALVLVIASAFALDALLGARRRESTTHAAPLLEPLAIVPPGPALVVTIDVARLQKTSAGRALLGKSLVELAGSACESALLSDVDALALAMPGEAAPGAPNPDALALVAAGRFRAKNVVGCADARIGMHRGEPVHTTLGSFTTVRDRRHTGEIAARDGLLIVSDGSYLRDLVDTADGKRAEGTPAERERDQLHAEFRRVVGRGAPIVATLALPPGWLGRLLADPAADRSPFAAIRTAALRADVSDHVEVAGVVGCDGADGAAHLERFLGDARADLATLVPGSADLFARARIARHDARLDFELSLSPADLDALSAQRDGGGVPGAQRDAGPDAGPQSHGP